MDGEAAAGHIVDVILSVDLSAVLGCEVEVARSERARAFLPWAATGGEGDVVEIGTSPALLGEFELKYYVAVGVRLSDLLRAPHDPSRGASAVRDVLADRSGAVVHVVQAPAGRSAVASTHRRMASGEQGEGGAVSSAPLAAPV